MTAEQYALIRVVQIHDTGQVSRNLPEQFQDPDIDKVAAVTRRLVAKLETDLVDLVKRDSKVGLSLSEIELEFGIDFGVEGEAEVKVPIIGPKVRGGAHGGATFAVKITLSKG
ncbi:MAG: hypothetical protein ACREUM_04940 [Nitrosospira sp.]